MFDYTHEKYNAGDKVIVKENAYEVEPGTTATVKGEIPGDYPPVLIHLEVDGDPYGLFLFYEEEFRVVK